MHLKIHIHPITPSYPLTIPFHPFLFLTSPSSTFMPFFFDDPMSFLEFLAGA